MRVGRFERGLLFDVVERETTITEPEPAVAAVPLQLLRCPRTGQPLRLIERDGAEMLATPDGKCVYEIRDGIPVLIASESIRD